MGGRGKPKAKGMVPPSVASSIQFGGAYGRGNANAAATPTAPSPKFPSITLPIPKEIDSHHLELVSEWQHLLSFMKSSIFWLSSQQDTLDIQRYSDKYTKNVMTNQKKIQQLHTIPSIYPPELLSILNPKAQKIQKVMFDSSIDIKKYEEMEVKEMAQKALIEKQKESQPEDDQDDEELVYDEDEFEEETDYNQSYFETGEDYGDYDDGDEGPVY